MVPFIKERPSDFSASQWVRFTIDRATVIFPDGRSKLFDGDKAWLN